MDRLTNDQLKTKNSKLKTIMNRLLLCTLLLVSCAKSPMVSYQTPIMGAFDPIIVTDADTTARQLHPGKCKYVPETYIINHYCPLKINNCSLK